jgi:hypothetical protein
VDGDDSLKQTTRAVGLDRRAAHDGHFAKLAQQFVAVFANALLVGVAGHALGQDEVFFVACDDKRASFL